MRSFRLVVLTLGLGLASTPALSQQGGWSTDIATHGSWTAYRAQTPTGRQLCGIRVVGAEGRTLHLKHFAGDRHVTFQAFKSSWTIPQGTRLRLSLRVDNNAPWTTGGAVGQRNFVEWTVAGGIERFEVQFRNGTRLFLEFPEGSEGPWVVSLTGSAAAMGRMVECMNAVRQGTGDAPRGGPTQPFGDAPRQAPPTQPFTPGVPQKPVMPNTRSGDSPIRHAI
ncbi:hypothetical protein [Sabulicella rubraurantiaca]|uniref:hypothetical protein n=1 Tax=Sabulicella rubraurantiaca TaxID=2811429 RepID=UPI001A97C124|nr:hypothetical protein [Sabulicella rubraurantiaca]